MRECPSCKAKIKENAKFCTNCGEKISDTTAIMRTKKCKKCMSDIDLNAKVCPNCRSRQGMPIWLIILLVFLAIGVMSSLADDSSSEKKVVGSTTTSSSEEQESDDSNKTNSDNDSKPSTNEKLTLLEHYISDKSNIQTLFRLSNFFQFFT